MAKNNNLTDFLTNLANKFRTKLGLSSTINPQNFEGLIDDVYTKGYNDAPSGIDVSDTTATKANVLTGKYFYNSSGSRVSGTMANKTGTTTGWCGYETCTVQPHPADNSQGLVTVPNTYNVPGYYDKTSSVTANLANLNASNIKKGIVVGRNGGNSSNSIVGTFSGYSKSGSKTGSNSTAITISGQSWGFTPNRIAIYCNQSTAKSDIAFLALYRDGSTATCMCSGTSNNRTFYNNAISFSNISATGFKATCPSSKKWSSSVTYYYLVWREE